MLKIIDEEKLCEVIFNFYKSKEKEGALVFPVNYLGLSRWYITKIENSFDEFLVDQPLIKEIIKDKKLSLDELRSRVTVHDGIGSWLRFVPGNPESSDFLVNHYNIQPYPIKQIDDIDDIQEYLGLFYDEFGKAWYYGPLYHNKKIDKIQCCYYEISKEELWKDIEKFREGNNEYYTSFDPLDFPF